MADENYIPDRFANFPHTRETSDKLKRTAPLPNIVRVEVLDYETQNQYLGLADSISGTYKEVFQKAREPNRALGEGIFYGFLKSGGDLSIAYSSDWKQNANGGGLLGSFQAVANTIIPPEGKIQQVVGASRNFLHDLTGVSMTSTGGSSLKSFTGMSMNGFVIECGWYMPEQEVECLGQLRQLMLMSYPAAATTNDVANGLNNLVNSIITGVSAAGEKAAADIGVPAALSGVPGYANIKSPLTPDPKSELAGIEKNGVLGGLINFGVTAAGTIGDIFGAAYTYDPRPVRLCIGHYADILPLVVTNVNISMSKEQFISGNGGRHLPVFCTVKINFDWWLTPHPQREFMGIFGNEFFGRESTIQNESQRAEEIAAQAKLVAYKEAGVAMDAYSNDVKLTFNGGGITGGIFQDTGGPAGNLP